MWLLSTIASFARLQPFLKEGTVFRDLGLKRFITNKLTRSGAFLVWYKPIVLSLVEMLTRHCVWPLCEADRMHLVVEALFRVQLHIRKPARMSLSKVSRHCGMLSIKKINITSNSKK